MRVETAMTMIFTMTTSKDEFLFGLKGKKYGGRIEGWVENPILQNEKVMGIVYDSPADKFEEGDVITTSRVKKIHEKDDKPYIVETHYSYYYLGDRGNEGDLDMYYQRFYKDKDNWM